MLASLALLGGFPDRVPAVEPGTASLSRGPDGAAQVDGLPALAPSLGMLIIQDPPDAVGVSDCIEVCSLDVSSGKIITQWTSRDVPGAKVALTSMGTLSDTLESTAFYPMQPMQPRSLGRPEVGLARRYSAPGAEASFSPNAGQAMVVFASGVQRAVHLPTRRLTCDGDPETGNRNVVLFVDASDLHAWVHAGSRTVLIRAVYPGNDQTCTRAYWHAVSP